MNIQVLEKLLQLREAAHTYEDFNEGLAYEVQKAIDEELASATGRTLVPAIPAAETGKKPKNFGKVRVRIDGRLKWMPVEQCCKVPQTGHPGWHWALKEPADGN